MAAETPPLVPGPGGRGMNGPSQPADSCHSWLPSMHSSSVPIRSCSFWMREQCERRRILPEGQPATPHITKPLPPKHPSSCGCPSTSPGPALLSQPNTLNSRSPSCEPTHTFQAPPLGLPAPSSNMASGGPEGFPSQKKAPVAGLRWLESRLEGGRVEGASKASLRPLAAADHSVAAGRGCALQSSSCTSGAQQPASREWLPH